MATRPIPSTRTPLPVVGLGTWQTFDPPQRTPAVLDELEATLRAFHAAGGRVIDSSPMYGAAEQLVGQLGERAGLLPALFLATKVWTTGEREGVRQMERSEALFRRTPIDLMQIHNLVDWRTHLATLRRWREQGRVRHVGVTHYTPSAYPELERVVTRERVDTVQLQYSAAVR